MQPPVLPVRPIAESLVYALIRDRSAVSFSGGCELLTGMDLMLAADISDDVQSGGVSRASYASMHGSASMIMSRELAWGSALVRPYITITDGIDEARFNLGAYFTNTPERDLAELPVAYDVECEDILSVLDDQVGDAYAVAKGTSYLVAIENLLVSQGVQKYSIDSDASSLVLPTDRVWMFDENTTWLTIINDLLGAIGYAGVWSDWDGMIRCTKYVSPRDRAPEWVYDDGILTSMLGDRTTKRDYYNAPNRWVFYRTNILDGETPVEGNGKYTYVNEYNGDTSVEQRGRTITRVVGIDAADHPSLVAAAQRTIDADMSIPTTINVTTFPNPLHWHMDVVRIEDEAYGPPTNALATKWTMALDGSGMAQEWTVLT